MERKFAKFPKVWYRQSLAPYSVQEMLLHGMPHKIINSWFYFPCYIKTHDSESRGQEEAAIIRETKITRPLSELFTRKTANKIANALAKLP